MLFADIVGNVKYDFLTSGGCQNISFIPESDVYRLIIRSKLPVAEGFEKWDIEEVLPTIRKTDVYITPQKLDDLLANPTSTEQLFWGLHQNQNVVRFHQIFL